MKGLNLEVGQKVWSIQLGDCEVTDIDFSESFPIRVKDKDGKLYIYTKDLKFSDCEYHPSLFESNPFDQSVKPNEMVENKTELINALVRTIEVVDSTEIEKIAQEKLKKVLEAL